jgi:hypothetical protein
MQLVPLHRGRHPRAGGERAEENQREPPELHQVSLVARFQNDFNIWFLCSRTSTVCVFGVLVGENDEDGESARAVCEPSRECRLRI